MPPHTQILAIIGVAVFASTLQRLSGFGFSLLATPLMALTIPVQQAVIALSIVSLVSLVRTWAQLHEHADRRQVTRLVAFAFVGMPVGLVVHDHVSEQTMRLILAGVVLLAVVTITSGLRIPVHHVARADGIAGFLSGVLNTTTGTNGPPLVVDLTSQNLSPDTMRGTLAGTFVVSNILGLIVFAADRAIGRHEIALGVIGIPFALLGQIIGTRLAPRVSNSMFRRLTIALLLITAATSVVNALR